MCGKRCPRPDWSHDIVVRSGVLVVDLALEHKRAFLSTWEIQFLNSIRVSCRHHSELTVAQKQMIRDIGKRLELVD